MSPITNHQPSEPTSNSVHWVSTKEGLEEWNSDFVECSIDEKKLFLPFHFWDCFFFPQQRDRGQKKTSIECTRLQEARTLCTKEGCSLWYYWKRKERIGSVRLQGSRNILLEFSVLLYARPQVHSLCSWCRAGEIASEALFRLLMHGICVRGMKLAAPLPLGNKPLRGLWKLLREVWEGPMQPARIWDEPTDKTMSSIVYQQVKPKEERMIVKDGGTCLVFSVPLPGFNTGRGSPHKRGREKEVWTKQTTDRCDWRWRGGTVEFWDTGMIQIVK